MPSVLLIGTLDTKGTELLFVRDLLRAAGVSVTVLDAGVRPHTRLADVLAKQAVRAAGGGHGAGRTAGTRAATAMAGTVGAARPGPARQAGGGVVPLPGGRGSDRPLVTATMFGVT